MDIIMGGTVEPVTVYFEDMDPMGVLYNSKYTNLFERASFEYWSRAGWPSDLASPDFWKALFVAKENLLTFYVPITRLGTVNVAFWIEKLFTTSVVYGFQILSEDRTIIHAAGSRVHVLIDPQAGSPTPISQEWRNAAKSLLIDSDGAVS